MLQPTLKEVYLLERKIRRQVILQKSLLVMMLCLLGMLLFSIWGLVQTEKDLDKATAEIERLKSRPPLVAKADPAQICPAWWFGKGSIQEVKRQICGRGW